MKKFSKAMLIASTFFSLSCFADVAVIVNTTNNNPIDESFIKKVYLGKAKSFEDGAKIEMYTLGDADAATVEFREKVLNKTNSQYKSYWSKLVFTGKGTPPKEMSNANEMINEVKRNTNTIGFIASDKVTDDVKVIATF